MGPGEIIGIVTGAGFLGMVLWASIWGWRPRYPKGATKEIEGAISARVILHTSIQIDPSKFVALAEAVHRALVITANTWDAAKDDLNYHSINPRKELDGFAVWFLPDQEYEAEWIGWKAMAKGSNAVLAQVPQPIGGGPPLAMIRSKFIDHAMETGSPVIHEALHALRRWDSFHQDPQVWIGAARELDAKNKQILEADPSLDPKRHRTDNEARCLETLAYASYRV